MEFAGYGSVRPFLYFDHLHIVDHFCTSTALLRSLYLDLFTLTRLFRPFVKYGLVIGREIQVEASLKYSFGRSKQAEVMFGSK